MSSTEASWAIKEQDRERISKGENKAEELKQNKRGKTGSVTREAPLGISLMLLHTAAATFMNNKVTADIFNMPVATVCRTVHNVVEEMMTILHRASHFPKPEEMEEPLTLSPGLSATAISDTALHSKDRKHGVLDNFEKRCVRWMMYWIVFALYTVLETITDLTLAWFPLYYELKIAIVIWLLSPYTRGASLIYRKCLHPLLSSREREIDEYIVQAKEKSYETMVNFGKQGLSIAATAAVTAAVKGQGAITEKLRSLSMHDLTQIGQQDDSGGNQLLQYSSHSANPAVRRSQSTDAAGETEYFYDQEERTDEENEPTFSEDEAVSQKGLRRSQSVKISRTRVRKDARYGSLKIKGKKRPALNSVNYGM
ncbi:receptor expression-enhancing protein 3-like [Micropterus dolomieu]|uniref:receptor expression-enhancing protein 3-like n=1 Tax=Micropterus dolomieu TaxID=147949 RepID=UPI001E8EB857|nr:receptor expression-enhancing protein 3-like [Micropterus dolomieu]